MGDNTGISWSDATWNPTAGCSLVSPGCRDCYAMPMAARLERMQRGMKYTGLTVPSKAGPVWTGRVNLADDETLRLPLRWQRPRRIFVNSMSDLYHPAIPVEFVDRVFGVMALASHHIFQVLTKRDELLLDWSARDRGYAAGASVVAEAYVADPVLAGLCPLDARKALQVGALGWPLPHVWIGVSVEDRTRLSRLRALRATPAAVRFVSAEPLLEDLGEVDLTGIGWVIAGGESGRSARPCHVDWLRRLKAQCDRAGVYFFLKQAGSNPIGWPCKLTGKGDDPGEWPADLRVQTFPPGQPGCLPNRQVQDDCDIPF